MDRILSSMKRIVGFVVVLLMVAGAGASIALAVEVSIRGRITDETGGKVRLVGAVVRNDGTGWRILGGTHEALGLSQVSCNLATGVLSIRLDPGAETIGSVWVNPDETLTRRGIRGGASVTRSTISMRFVDGQGAVGCASAKLQGLAANVWVGGVFT
jgi:hypothetical protein